MKVFIIILSSLFLLAFLNLGHFLDTTQKEEKSDFIFCLGGAHIESFKLSFNLLENGFSNSNELVYVGTKDQLLWSIKKDELLKEKINNANITYTNIPKNTMDEIKFIDEYMYQNKYNSVLIVTEPPHSRRVDFLINNYAKNLNQIYTYKIVGSKLEWWDKDFYFMNSKSFTISILELSKITYNYIKYTFLYETEIIKKLDIFSKNIKSYFYKNYGV